MVKINKAKIVQFCPFLDELTTALDARSAIFVRDLIRRLKDEDITTLFLGAATMAVRKDTR